MTERESKYSDAMDVLAELMEGAPTTLIMLGLSRVIGEVHDMMHAEQALPAEVEESVQ